METLCDVYLILAQIQYGQTLQKIVHLQIDFLDVAITTFQFSQFLCQVNTPHSEFSVRD